MTIIDATTVSAILVVLALVVLAVLATAGVALAQIHGVSRPTTVTGPSPLAVPGRVVAISH